MKKLLAICFTFFIVLISITTVVADSYTYVEDSVGLFDDSANMTALCAEIRNKLDFNIGVISIPVLEDKEAIIDSRRQDSTAFLIFVTPNEEMDYWVGSAVPKTIREVELELLFHTYPITDKQYTKTVNQLLSAIVSVYINGDSLDDHIQKEDLEIVDEKQDSWMKMTWKYMINFIKTHPVRIILIIIFLIGLVLYYYNFGRKHVHPDDTSHLEE